MPYLIYLLSGLLTIHGIVCLLGAFFPFYPPVFLFYIFFPGHFAIRLIIVLLIGAAQLVYGVYLALGQKWKIRWYWPAIATIVIAGLLLVYPAIQDPGLFGVSAGKDELRQPILFKEMPPVPVQGEAADDIVPTPGGGIYRANLHQQGVKNPWPPIESTDVVLGDGLDALNVSYRDYIKTEAGETRNNIVRIRKQGGLFNRNLVFYSVNAPTGITLTDGGRGIGLPGTLGAVLVIEVSPDVRPGEYTFGIGVEIDGKDYGTVPCTIEVSGHAILNSRGITDVTIQPEPGQILVYDKQDSAGVILKSVTIKPDVCDKDYFDRPRGATVRKGEPCLLVTGQVESQLDQDKYMTLSARGYDVNGEEVTYVLDHGPIWGVISLFVPAKGVDDFILHLKTAPDVVKIELMPSPELYDIPPP